MSDITYVTIAAGFVYVAVMDAWSRKVVGYAIGRSIDARSTAKSSHGMPSSDRASAAA